MMIVMGISELWHVHFFSESNGVSKIYLKLNPMDCCQNNREFDAKRAQKRLKDYRKNGPGPSTRVLIGLLQQCDVKGFDLLDIGSGVGSLHLELLDYGLSAVVSVEASRAYQEASQQEAENQGKDHLVKYHYADFVAAAAQFESADIVTLDKVICCYPIMSELVSKSLAKARNLYCVILPRDTWWVKLVQSTGELAKRTWGNSFRTYVHSISDFQDIVTRAGFELRHLKYQREWMIAVYRKTAVP